MELNGEQRIPLSRERVWSGLMDPLTLKAAIPGCESVVDEGNGTLNVIVVAAIGPVKARFKGQLQLQNVQAPMRYTLLFEGSGGMAGFAKGSAKVELEPLGPDETRLVYRAQADIGGRLAQIGSRLVDAAAAHMAAQFFEKLVQVLQAPLSPEGLTAASASPIPAARPASAGATPTSAPVLPTTVAPSGSVVTIQMPAWTWAFTITVLAALSAYMATH